MQFLPQRAAAPRRAVAGGVAIAAVLASAFAPISPATADEVHVATSTSLFTEEFRDPSNPNRAMMRLWMPLAEIDEAELRHALTDIADKGFGGVEIGAFAVPGAPAAEYGWDSDRWNDAMRTALEIAAEPAVDLRVDFMVTANYPTAAPSTYVTPDQPGSEKELAWGAVKVPGGTTFSAPAPAPLKAPAASVQKQDLVAVVAARLLPGQNFEGANLGTANVTPLTLDRSSTQVLELPASDAGTIEFAAPAGGDWVLTSYWLRGSGAINPDITSPQSYVVDHLSTTGTEAWTQLWEDELLADPESRELIKDNGGYLFEDSLHLESYQLWTDEFFDEFEARRGYDVTPYLPTLLIPDLNRYFNRGTRNADTTLGSFEYEQAGVGQKIRNDYYQTLTDLYVEKHIEVMDEWADQFNLGLRFQPSYGQSLEQSAPTFAIDVPETESFQHGNQIDAFRYISSAAHASDKPVISTECCAERGQGNALGWQSTLPLVHNNFAGGVNNVVFHGYSYNKATNATWPGWLRFGQNSFSENYGKQPTWETADGVVDLLGREQTVLRQGRQVTDVAVYRHSYWDQVPGGSQYYADGGALQGAGFSYGFVSPAMLDLDTFTVRDGRLDADGAGYRALVIDNETRVPVAAMRHLLEVARAGLPLVLVGSTPEESAFFGEAGDAPEIKAITNQLIALGNVVRVSTTADVPAVLRELSVRPDAEPSAPTTAIPVRRSSSEADFYFLYNKGTAPVSQTYRLTGTGRPYVLDAATGDVTPIAEYDVVGGRTVVEVELAPNETTVLALSDSWGTPALNRLPHVVGTSAAEAVYDTDGDLSVRATEAGPVTATLSDGRELTVTAPAAPAVELGTEWRLQVESWEQASGDDPYTIKKVAYDRTVSTAGDGTLKPWQQIAGMADVSGVGTYTGTIKVDRSWSATSGAWLDLGRVYDTFTVRVNGRELPGVNHPDPRVDLAPYLQAGDNTVEIVVGTTLRNRMRVISGPAATPSTAPRQDYGVFGPISTTSYQEVALGLAEEPEGVAGVDVTGDARIGGVLRARATGTDGWTLRYQWLRNGRAIAGATNAAYRVTGSDAGRRLAVRISDAGSARTSTSKSVAVAKAVATVAARVKTPVARGTRPQVVVRVSSATVKRGVVKVRVIRAGRTIATRNVAVPGGDRKVVRLRTSTRRLAPGVYTVVASYGGNDQTQAGRSKPVKFRVR